jgi:hypothetical protein
MPQDSPYWKKSEEKLPGENYFMENNPECSA